MSELTPCNYCNLNRIKHRAKQSGRVVTTIVDNEGWTDVYLHPPEVTEFPKRNHNDEWPQYLVSSMMKITNHCVC
jgi:hypothetical protein